MPDLDNVNYSDISCVKTYENHLNKPIFVLKPLTLVDGKYKILHRI